MSIELDNPQTPLEMVDAAANFVAQMRLAHMVRDEATFTEAADRADTLLAEATRLLDEADDA